MRARVCCMSCIYDTLARTFVVEAADVVATAEHETHPVHMVDTAAVEVAAFLSRLGLHR